MKRFVAVILAITFSCALHAQQSRPNAAEKAAQPQAATAPATVSPEARAEDVQSMDAIVKALYGVISGPAGPRDWNRFEALFTPDARLTVTGKNPEGIAFYRSFTTKGYEERTTPIFQREGFFENEIHNVVEQFGHVAQVWSTYESRHEKGGPPFARGINSIQLLNDGKRWWVVSVLWDSERPDNPIPEKYVK